MTCSTTDLTFVDGFRPAKVALVAEWLIAGMRPSQVPAQAEKLDWSIEHGELAAIIIEAQDLIIADARINPALEDAKAVDRLNGLYAKSLAIQDYKACLAIQKELNQVVARLSNPMLRKAPTGKRSDG